MLDEGIDVPDANLGVVMSASRTRRQMIQRMGRILRRKRPGVAARFVIMFAKDTLEDPSNRIERDGFLDEIERIAEATGVFDETRFEELDAFLAAPGPQTVPEPEHLERYEQAAVAAGAPPDFAFDDAMIDSLTEALGVEVMYALLTFARDLVPARVMRRRSNGSNCAFLQPGRALGVSGARTQQSAADRKAAGQAEAPLDWPGCARDRAHRRRVANQLYRVRRGISARRVPVAGPRANRPLPLRLNGLRSAERFSNSACFQGRFSPAIEHMMK